MSFYVLRKWHFNGKQYDELVLDKQRTDEEFSIFEYFYAK